MSNSSLVSVTRISPNKTAPRNHKIDTITIHCVVGQATAQSVLNHFSDPKRKASSNYVIGVNGEVGMAVEEKDRSWCSSSASNDNRAITIECASDLYSPYAVNNKVYQTLINLCADICRRNDIPELRWKADKSLIGHPEKQNLTVHRWFANKSCPGDYLYERMGHIAESVNAVLRQNGSNPIPITQQDFKVKIDRVGKVALNIRTGPGTNYQKCGEIGGTGVFTIKEVKEGLGAQSGWGRLKSGAGWISLDYCERV